MSETDPRRERDVGEPALSELGGGEPAGDVPDVLAPGLKAVFCGINPGRVSAAAGLHFANPRNDFWRLLAAAGLTPRLLSPSEHDELLRLGLGITNAALRTTPGSGDLRRADFARAAERLGRVAAELRPRAIAFVGKEAYRGAFGERPQHGPQPRHLFGVPLFVLPSTSPANAAVPYGERLRWFRAFAAFIEPALRESARALVLDRDDRVLLVRFHVTDTAIDFWATPGGGLEPGESHEQALRRELAEEVGLRDVEPGRAVWTREHAFPWQGRVVRQAERYWLLRPGSFELAPGLSREQLLSEGVHETRWWTLEEIERATETFAPRGLARLVRELLRAGPPPEPVDISASEPPLSGL